MAKVLIAEDEPSQLDQLEGMLKALGHEVTAVSDGIYASEALKDGMFNLIISDNKMPGKKGSELLETLRAKGDQTPFILRSGDPGDYLPNLCKRLGALFSEKSPRGTRELPDLIAQALAKA